MNLILEAAGRAAVLCGGGRCLTRGSRLCWSWFSRCLLGRFINTPFLFLLPELRGVYQFAFPFFLARFFERGGAFAHLSRARGSRAHTAEQGALQTEQTLLKQNTPHVVL